MPPDRKAFRAKDEIRTRDPDLGKVVLYQLSYFRIVNIIRCIPFSVMFFKEPLSVWVCKYTQIYISAKKNLINNWGINLSYWLSAQEKLNHFQNLYPEGS